MNTIIQINVQTLEEFVEVLMQIEIDIYSVSCSAIGGATIGQHTRHVIELFQCLLTGYVSGEVKYDKRNRDKEIEENLSFAIYQIQLIQKQLAKPDKKLFIEYEFNENIVRIESNYFREVMYNLEHIIHHQALIKVGLNMLSTFELPNSFGVAPSTIKYRKECAQKI